MALDERHCGVHVGCRRNAFIMWMGELITQRGIGNGMSLIIFVNIMSGVPSAICSSVRLTTDYWHGHRPHCDLVLVVHRHASPLIIFVERAPAPHPGQLRQARRQGRRMMGGQSTYLPLKVNAAGVIPIIFASCDASTSRRSSPSSSQPSVGFTAVRELRSPRVG